MNKILNDSVIYEIYPTSFFDSNGDGIGDFNGIAEKLFYLRKLGIDIIWLNSIFQSPFMDGGYDVTDYKKVNSKFGTLEDFSLLVKKAHLFNIRVLIDFIPGHTSIEHEWFKKSCEREKNKYSNYYVWTNSWAESAPNSLNGLSDRDGCVLTNYYSFQPALNYGFERIDKPWQTPYDDESLKPLRDEICSIMKYWLTLGVDGFRIDLASTLVKNRETLKPLVYLWNKIISEVKVVNSNAIFMAEWGDPISSVGECGFDADYLNHENLWYNQLLRLEENSNILRCCEGGNSYFHEDGLGDIDNFVDISFDIIKNVKGKGYYVLPTGYHDIPRFSINRSQDQMKVFFAFLLTYKTVPMIYYGDEIGMKYIPNICKDGGYDRTGSRTPMQWNNEKNRGFSTADKTYLPVDDSIGIDVEEQLQNENSLLNTVKKIIAFRKQTQALYYDGNLNIVEKGYPFIYERTFLDTKITVLLNPSKNEYKKTIGASEVVLSNNCEFIKNDIILKGESFAIIKSIS